MSSWVAPIVAAEIWGISVDQVLAGVANGSIPSMVDGQFLFVDLSGNGFAHTSPQPTPTEVEVTEEEFAALTFQPKDSVEDCGPMEESEPEGVEEAVHDVGSWRTARRESSRLRRPPTADAA